MGIHLADFLAGAGPCAQAPPTRWVSAAWSLALTYLSLVIGELVPKRLALAYPERAASLSPSRWRSWRGSACPWSGCCASRPTPSCGCSASATGPSARVTEEEIRALLAEGAQAGVVKPIEHELIEGVMRIADRPVRSIMTPRVELVWLDVDASYDTLRTMLTANTATAATRSAAAVSTIWSGIVHVRELLPRPPGRRAVRPRGTRPSGGDGAREHLRHPDRRAAPAGGSQRLAIVLDEYGVVEGVVAPADVLTAIAGELSDDSAEEPDAVRRADGSWLVDGRMEIHRLERLLDRRDLDRGGRYQTLAGLVLWELGRMPQVGDTFRMGDLRFEVVDLDRRRIDKVLIGPWTSAT